MTASITLSSAALARLDECAGVFLGADLVVLLRRVGWHYLQGAIAPGPEGRAWLIVDEPGVVKSATALFLREGRRGRVVVMAAGTPIVSGPDVDTWSEGLIDPDVIAFVSIGTNSTRAEALGSREALALLIRSAAGVMIERASAQGHLDLLGRLARQARGFRVQLAPELFTRLDRLQELIA